MALGVAVFDLEVLMLDEAQTAQALAKRHDHRRLGHRDTADARLDSGLRAGLAARPEKQGRSHSRHEASSPQVFPPQ
jgi:hypothetical protein